MLFYFGETYRTAPEPMSRDTNFRFALTWTYWVWQLATGGDSGDRTHDLLNAIQALSQLSYTPKWICKGIISYERGNFKYFFKKALTYEKNRI